MGLSTPGIGSGLDIQAIVEKLVNADIMSAQVRHDKKYISVNTELSAMGQIKSAISGFQTTLDSLTLLSEFQKTQYTLSESGYISAAITGEAAEGTYQIQVQQLAQAQGLASDYFADSNAIVGSGTITINFGTYSNNNTTFTPNTDVSALSINIAPGSDSLTAVCDAINAADGGVVAAIVQDSLGARLTLTSTQTGENYAMQIEGSLAALNYDPTTNNTGLNQTMAAQNSMVKINGLVLNQNTNELDNALRGITLNLLQTNASETITLTVTHDTDHAKSLINDFVRKYNDFTSFLTSLSGYNKDTKKRGALQGDALLIELKSNLYKIVTSPVTSGSPVSSLADLGITSNKKGLLEIDPEMLDDAIKNNYQAIGNLFAKKITATDPNIKINSFDADVPSGSYDVILSEYTPGVSILGTVGGKLSTSTDGTTLTGSGDLSNLSIDILSGSAGNRGKIIVTDGLASLINDFLDSYLEDDGELEERIDRLDNKSKQLAEDQQEIDMRAATLEKKYFKQWNAVDLLLSQMQNTTNTLNQLLSNIPKLKTK